MAEDDESSSAAESETESEKMMPTSEKNMRAWKDVFFSEAKVSLEKANTLSKALGEGDLAHIVLGEAPEGEGKKTRKKKDKDPNAPRRAESSYQAFARSQRDGHKAGTVDLPTWREAMKTTSSPCGTAPT